MSRKSLWDRVEPMLAGIERPARYIDSEWGARTGDDAGYHAVLLYPDVYDIGQANQALAILYERVNAVAGVRAERAYVPWVDMAEAMREADVPLFALESSCAVADFDLLGITLPYELTYSNIVEALDLARIPLYASDRKGRDTLVVGGGPCAFNPEPVAPFFDAIVIGEAEHALPELIEAHRASIAAGHDRETLLSSLAAIPGVYVPSLYEPRYDTDNSFAGIDVASGAPERVVKRVLGVLDELRPPVCPIVPYMDVVHDRFAIEVMRGCTRGCRFCQAGMVYRPVRERAADVIVRDAIAGISCTGYDEVSLTSLSTTDHSVIEEVVRRLTTRFEGTGVSVSLPSLRVDSFGVEMARLASSGRKSGLTFAPEAGTQRLRDVINKNVTDSQLVETVTAAFVGGWKRVKLYFMIGLPTETDDDVRAIGDLVAECLRASRSAVEPSKRGSVRIAVSVSTFVPKAHTPFQFEPQITLDEVKRRQTLLRESMPRKGVELSWHDAEVSFLEGVMARGDRRLASVIERAWHDGARFDAWSEHFNLDVWIRAFAELGLDPSGWSQRGYAPDAPLAWDHISCGVSREYLAAEHRSAHCAVTTPDCTVSGCTACDACDELGVPTSLAGDRRAW